jgi:hypothetical protein
MEGEATQALADRRVAVAAACAALKDLSTVLWQCQNAELGPLLGEIDALARAAEAGRVAVVGEALERGEANTSPAGPPSAWVEHWAPSFHAGGAGRLVDVARDLRKDINTRLRASVLGGRCSAASAAVVMKEMDRIHHRLVPDAVPTVMAGLVHLAETGRPGDIRKLRPRLIAEYGSPGDLQADEDAARRAIALSQPWDGGDGVREYRLVLDPAGSAVLEAALGPLSSPQPAGGAPDLRSSDQRRGEALVDIVRRAVGAAESVPVNPKTQLIVTMDYTDLADQLRAATVVGGPAAGTLIAPETVRQLCCDAAIIPAVLGSKGEVLDLGRAVRWFTPAQLKTLWVRDGGCTFPECTMPAHWSDAHHLHHWADGGPTDIDWAALLCGRHHTVVHNRRLHGEVRDGRVQWNLTRGSYDHWLQGRRPDRR